MKGNNKQDCEAFRQWLYALTRSELLNAMDIDFHQESYGKNGATTSHEYDLLIEMVQLQPPPPTPIHPQAVGFKPVSKQGLPIDYSERERLRTSQPRLFQWSERKSYRPKNQKGRQAQTSRFDMIARKKITSWGEVLSVGATQEQLDADDRIVRGSYIRKIPGNPNVSLTFREAGLSSQSIIRMLQVASRGYFLTTTCGNKLAIPFCSPFLQPTERWFSLSFYLSSRYHVALWESFCNFHSSTMARSKPIPNYDEKALQVAIPAATQQGIRKALQNDLNSLQYLRDTLLWHTIDPAVTCIIEDKHRLLHHHQQHSSTSNYDWNNLLECIILTPLLQMASNEYVKVKDQIVDALQHTLVAEMEKAIVIDALEETQDHENGETPTKSKQKKKKKKGGKRTRQKSRRVSFLSDNQNDSDDENGNVAQKGEEPNSGKEQEQQESKISRNDQMFDFPKNDVPPLERNRNIVLSLGILDDVLEKVFTKVGLSATPTAFEATVIDKSNRKGRSNEAKKQGPETERGYRIKNSLQRPPNGKPAEGKRGANGQLLPIPQAKQTVAINAQNKKSPTPKQLQQPRQARQSPPLHHPHQHQQQTNNFRIFSLDSNQPGHITAQPPFDVDWSVGASFTDEHHDVQPIFLPDEAAGALPTDFHKPLGADDFPFVANNEDQLSPLDGWPFLSRYQARDQSILTDFFQTQEDKIDEDEKLMAASTAASISSSTYKDAVVVVDIDEMDKTDHEEPLSSVTIVRDMLTDSLKGSVVTQEDSQDFKTPERPTSSLSSKSFSKETTKLDPDETEEVKNMEAQSNEDSADIAPPYESECRSPSPQAPLTPPPTLSPILVSLADLKDLKNMKTKSLTPELAKVTRSDKPPKRSASVVGLPGSLPNSPVPPQKNGLTPSWSREDLRIAAFHDDHGLKPKRPHSRPNSLEKQQSYKAAAVKSLARPIASSRATNFDFRSNVMESPSSKKLFQRESCAQSETAVEGHSDEQQWQSDTRRQTQDDTDNKSTTKDETTTITSALSHREQEDHSSIRDERNSFRDMCLTLGAEVSKLKAMLAAQRAASIVAPVDYQDNSGYPMYNPGPFDPNGMPPFFHGIQRGQRVGAMSDAGVHRGGDHESQVSEDEVYSEVFSKARVDVVRRMSSSQTMLGSDASVENNGSIGPSVTLGALPVYDSVTLNGLQSRLTKDILRFLNATSMQLRKQDGKRRMAVERFSRLVNTIWPRAQVKLYGSHVSGLCLPSSDLDFVICLPAVHKNAPALAPGVLEGRNAINETSQKLLARELKGESWVDPRSIKLIERTVVPVIKVSTKDTRARMLQLDISFDSPEHHGLHANQMVTQILGELPLIRPLMLVLKQFLLDRGLLTSYTGGLSSYCLFLMVARYLQEQSPVCLDCGSLLMGFLDFHGNHFDPRATGISVYRRQYFARPNYAVASYQANSQPMWHPPHQHHAVPNSPSQQVTPDFRRRNSFSDTGSVDGKRRSQTPASMQRPPRFQPARFNATAASHAVNHDTGHRSVDHCRPFTFDPLFVEDPLSAGNNVGRNAFRIFQVQRAFSDAHRALVASLEWDIHSSGDLTDGADYPLLKCLLHSEDVLYEL